MPQPRAAGANLLPASARRLLAAATVALIAAGGAFDGARAAGDGDAACVRVGTWLTPASGATVTAAAVLDRLAGAPAVLLGESHTAAEDHRWQLDTAAQLYARNANMVLAFEAFPRRLQPVLDRWTAGTMSEAEFLDAVEWSEVWGYPARFYLPLFHFARRHRLPMVAMNVDRSLISQVARQGWEAIPPAERRGVGDPAPASPAYRERLMKIFEMHERTDGGAATVGDDAAEAAAIAAARGERFVAAQLAWDRAMAEAIARTHRAGGAPLVIGIVGRGHLEYGFGIPHQLRDLGIAGAASLLTWPKDRDCQDLVNADGVAIADAVFGIDTFAAAAADEDADRPRLGVVIEDAGTGARIVHVLDPSVAASAGLEPGDVVVRAAGRPMSGADDLKAVVRKVLAGTRLPLQVERDGERLDLVADFPPAADGAK